MMDGRDQLVTTEHRQIGVSDITGKKFELTEYDYCLARAARFVARPFLFKGGIEDAWEIRCLEKVLWL